MRVTRYGFFNRIFHNPPAYPQILWFSCSNFRASFFIIGFSYGSTTGRTAG